MKKLFIFEDMKHLKSSSIDEILSLMNKVNKSNNCAAYLS